MTVRRSPFTVLGLRPGADRSAVDDAYRRLMKQHHPDIPGGDPEAAAEINRAYAVLKRHLPPGPGQLPARLPALAAREGTRRAGRRRGALSGLAMLIAAGMLALWLPDRKAVEASASDPVDHQDRAALTEPSPDTLDLSAGPDAQAIATAVDQAVKLRATGLASQSEEVSRSCDADLAAYPSPALLDHCVAFDAASSLLGDERSLARFQPAPMAARHLEAALRVSDDPVLAEERVVSVRQMVQQLLVRMETERASAAEAAAP